MALSLFDGILVELVELIRPLVPAGVRAEVVREGNTYSIYVSGPALMLTGKRGWCVVSPEVEGVMVDFPAYGGRTVLAIPWEQPDCFERLVELLRAQEYLQ